MQTNLLGNGTETCKFCQVINKEAESYIIFEDELTLGFLDIRPLFPGHVLIVPKTHYASLSEIPSDAVSALFNNAKKISIALESGFHGDGTFIALNNKVSQSIPHVHVHVVPRRFKDGLKGFFWPRYQYKSKEEITQTQETIIRELQK
jgi:histidine triad (HIT) family protein